MLVVDKAVLNEVADADEGEEEVEAEEPNTPRQNSRQTLLYLRFCTK